jgi:hypothetical protein
MNDVPDNIRELLRAKLWAAADERGWISLSTSDKSKQYESWVRDEEIGGALSGYINVSDVRVYIKDTLMKDYAQDRLKNPSMPCRVLGIKSEDIVKAFTKPHGRILTGGRLIVWGQANAWKTVLMAAYERSYSRKNLTIHAVILTHAVGRYKQEHFRKMVNDAAKSLGAKRLEWID